MVIGAESGAATGPITAEALRQDGLRWRGPEQPLEHVIALSAGAALSWGAEMLRRRLWSDGRLAAAKKANQRQGCNSTYTIKETLLIPFNPPE